jgi:hypothetical protein
MADNETTKMNITNPITINGVKFPAGTNVTVPKNQADDIARMDYDHNKYLQTLHVKRKFEVNAGSIGAGGGAE